MAKKRKPNWEARARWLLKRAESFKYFEPGTIGYFPAWELDWARIDAFIKTKALGRNPVVEAE